MRLIFMPLHSRLLYSRNLHIRPLLIGALALLIGFGESCTPKTGVTTTDEEPVSTSAPQTNPKQSNQAPTPRAQSNVPASVDEVSVDLVMPQSPLPFNEDVRRGTLENGLAYYILENQKPDDRAELRLMVKAGSILEDDDQQGLAHFVEHMAFNGTENYAENDLIDYLQSTGAKFGPDLNAYTSFDETVYLLQVRTDSAEMLDRGLGILRDWAGGITFADEEIDKERGVVLSEWRSGLGAQERMRNKTLPVIFANSRYADRLPIGDTTVLKQAPYDALKRYYRDWYRPDLMGVAVVGDVDADDVEEQLKSLFATLENPSSPRERTEYDGPSYDDTQIVIATDPEAQFTLVQVNNLLPDAETKTVADFRQNLASQLYNQMLGARFSELTERPDAAFSFANSSRSGLVGNVDAYSSFALPKPGQAIEALIGVLNENKRVLVHGFLDTELERAKANVLDAARNAAKEADKTPSGRFAGGLVQSFLREQPLVDAATRLTLTEKLLEGVTLEEVNALAAVYLEDRPRAVVVTAPTGDAVPTEADVKRALFRAKTMRVEPYVDQVASAVELPALTPVAVSNTESFDSAGVTILTLANGVRVAYKSTDFSENEIVFSGVSKGGSNLFEDSAYPSAEMANGIGSAMGLGPYTPSALQKVLAGKRVRLNASIGSTEERLSGTATPETLRDLFELIYLHFQGGAYDADLAEAFMQQQRSFIENIGNNPQFAFAEAVTQELYGTDNPRHQLPSLERLDAMNTEAAYGLYRERFANATDWQFNFVGNFDIDTLSAFAKTYLGNLPSTSPADSPRDPGDKLRTGNLERRFKAGQAPKANILLARGGEFENSERERLVFQTMIGALNEELRDKLREDLGGVYGVSVNGNVELRPREEYFTAISFNAEPERVDELLVAASEVIERFKSAGPKEKTLASYRTTSYEQMKSAMRTSNGFWLPVMERAYTLDRDIDNANAERLKMLLADISAADVQAATRKYFDTAASTKLKVVMEPEG